MAVRFFLMLFCHNVSHRAIIARHSQDHPVQAQQKALLYAVWTIYVTGQKFSYIARRTRCCGKIYVQVLNSCVPSGIFMGSRTNIVSHYIEPCGKAAYNQWVLNVLSCLPY